MNIIELHNIDKTYHGKGYEVHALRNVSVTVKKGELLAVMGTSGSGKTTLLNILGMIDSFDSGKYTLNGTDVSCMNEKELAAMRNKTIGFVNQDFALIDRYSVKKNVELPLRYMGGAGKGKKARTPEILKRLGIEKKANNYPTELSGGQKQRVAIARALITAADIILADEPTGALDSQTSKEIMSIFSEIAGTGRTVIIVTHDPQIAQNCSRIIRIEDGRIV